MALDWIKMRIDLQSHPKVVRILSATKSDKFRVIGGLLAVWSVFDTHCTDGKLDGYTPELMDHVIGWEGFSSAMISVGWLRYNGEQTLEMPEFTEHNGKSAKRRAEDQKRKRNARNTVEIHPKKSGQNADRMRTREEKRREEIYSPSENITQREKFAPPIPPTLLADWMEVRKGKRVGKLTKTAWVGIENEARRAGISPVEAVTICCQRGWAGFNADWDWKPQQEKKKTQEVPWWSSDPMIIAKGRELGLEARPGESMGQFKGRIQEKIAGVST